MARSVDRNNSNKDLSFPIFSSPLKAQTRHELTGHLRINGARFNPAYIESRDRVEPGTCTSTLQASFASSTSYVSIRRVQQENPRTPDTANWNRQEPSRSSVLSNSSSDTYISIGIYERQTRPFYLKALALIIGCSIIATAITWLLIVMQNREGGDGRVNGCESDLAHFGHISITTCTFDYSTLMNAETIQLKTSSGSDINFMSTFGNDSVAEVKEKSWTLKFTKSNDTQRVNISIQSHIKDCKMRGRYEIVLLNGATILDKLSYDVTIADDFETTSNLTSYINNDMELPKIELRCDGTLYCKDFLYFDANIDEGENKIKNESMSCTLKRNKAGVVQTSCLNEWNSSDFSKNTNATLHCVPSLPSDENNTRNQSEKHNMTRTKDICARNMSADVSAHFEYVCRKMLNTNEIGTDGFAVQLFKHERLIEKLTISSDGSQKSNVKGRYELDGQIEGGKLVLRLSIKEVYRGDHGQYTFNLTNSTAITFMLNVEDVAIHVCETELAFPVQQQKNSYSCQLYSENNVSLHYESHLRPTEGYGVFQVFDHKLHVVNLTFVVANMSCESDFDVYVFGDMNKTITITTEDSNTTVKQEFSNGTTVSEMDNNITFTHYLGCFANNITLNVTGEAVIGYTNITTESHLGVTLEANVQYKNLIDVNGSVIYSNVTYYDRNMNIRQSEDNFEIFHIPIDFCHQRQSGCNYRHPDPSFSNRFLSCSDKKSLPIAMNCPSGTTEWKETDCHGNCE